MNRRGWWIGAALVLLLIGAAGAWMMRGSAAPLADDEVEDEDPDWERWVLLDEREGAPRSSAGGSGDPPPPPPDRWAERREGWRQHWRQSVEIVPLGPSQPTLDPDSIREALAPGRDALRDCIRDAGGWRAMRRESRPPRGAAEEGRRPRQRRSVSFDVRPDGTVDPESVELDPPMPAALDACFRAYFSAPRLEGAGEDGARVELPMGPSGRRRGGRSGDAGVVGRWRDRRRGGEEGDRPRWEGREGREGDRGGRRGAESESGGRPPREER